MPFSGIKNNFSLYAPNSFRMWDAARMIAEAQRYVDREKGMNRYRFLRLKFFSSGWLKPGALRNPPFNGPSTNGMGPLRRKKAKGLGNAGDIGLRRRTTSNSPARMRRRNFRQACHSKATANGYLRPVNAWLS